ncbi:MAG: aldehyde dehydrogenase family protein [Acidimicrobiales bacterium]
MQTQLLINGVWADGSDGDRFVVVNPATGEEIATVAAGTAADATAACDAAAAAQKRWAAEAPRVQAKCFVGPGS